jgi:hypothetical protein
VLDVDAFGQKWPLAHRPSHVPFSFPNDEPNRPAGQGTAMSLVEPAGQKKPRRQGPSQAEEGLPVEVPYRPALQGPVHEAFVLPRLDPNRPAGHGRGVETMEPAGQ